MGLTIDYLFNIFLRLKNVLIIQTLRQLQNVQFYEPPVDNLRNLLQILNKFESLKGKVFLF